MSYQFSLPYEAKGTKTPWYISKNEEELLVTIGAWTYVGHLSLATRVIDRNRDGHILIGRYCSLAENIVASIAHNHEYRFVSTSPYLLDASFQGTHHAGRDYQRYQAIVGHDVWIGSGARFFGGIILGNGAVVAGNAVVTKNVPPYAIVAGNPARIVKYRFDEETRRKLNRLKWWYWTEKEIEERKKYFNNPARLLEFYEEKELSSEVSSVFAEIKAQGIKTFYFAADFGAAHAVWKDVFAQFKAYLQKSHVPAYLFVDVPMETGYASERRILEERAKELGDNVLILEHTGEDIALDVLSHCDYLITTKLEISSKVVDYGMDYGVKVLFGNDWDIFSFVD